MTLREITPLTLQDLDNVAVEIYEAIVNEGFIPRRRVAAPTDSIDTHISQDIDGFFALVQSVMTDFQNRKNIIAKDGVGFTEEAPPKDLITEVISFKLIRRVPGAQSGSVPDIISDSNVKREWRPRTRYQTLDASKPLKNIAVMGQYFDNVVEFTCWAATNKAANERAFWLEDLMQTYHWYFKFMGIKEIIYLQRLEDKFWEDIKTQGNLLKSRSLQYYVKTDKTFEVSVATLRDILINVAVGTD